jgi:coproporphyrinogen III oxidase
MQLAQSKSAQEAYGLVQELQNYLVTHLEGLPSAQRFQKIEWLRAQGKFGGGARYIAPEGGPFNRASVNISQVQYEADPERKLGSATAISTIVHPSNPHAPSMHMHISWTEMKSGQGYWRIMADLNPSLPYDTDTAEFLETFARSVPQDLYSYGKEQGNRYFFIPALGRHRGVAHFYLEEYTTSHPREDFELARRFGRNIVETYTKIVKNRLEKNTVYSSQESRFQLEYHTLYFLQVLTLDRGTTSGLLVHNENDTGILGSLPSHVDKVLLKSWVEKLPEIQQPLLQGITDILSDPGPCLVDDDRKVKIAEFSREFYKKYPEAQDFLAKGDRIPPTQQNHST